MESVVAGYILMIYLLGFQWLTTSWKLYKNLDFFPCYIKGALDKYTIISSIFQKKKKKEKIWLYHYKCWHG